MELNIIKVWFVFVIICCLNEPTVQEYECVATACACYDNFFFVVFKLVLPPIILKLSVDRKNDLDKFDEDLMESTVRDTLFETGVENLIHLIADEESSQKVDEPEEKFPDRRSSKNLSFICISVYADLGTKMLTFLRNLYRIRRVPTIEDVQLNFANEFDLNLNALSEPV